MRRTAELVRSWLGQQERWQLWGPLSAPPAEVARCGLSARTVQRWLNRAGEQARRTVPGQLAGVPTTGQLATDGLWARLRGGTTRVVLLLTDSVSGVVWPPVVATGEHQPGQWQWCWRDFRLGLGHGRNHGSVARLERAALRWAVYRNFTPAQGRRERKRIYRSAGLCPLARAGVPRGAVSYLDALAV